VTLKHRPAARYTKLPIYAKKRTLWYPFCMVEELTYLEQLRSIAMDQHGFVTTSQAADIGISKDELSKMKQR
jgi:hypothetical protein